MSAAAHPDKRSPVHSIDGSGKDATTSLATIARRSARHPWLVITGWIVLLAFAAVSIIVNIDYLADDDDFITPPESMQAEQLFVEGFLPPGIQGSPPDGENTPPPDSADQGGPDEVIIVRSDSLTVDDAAFHQAVTDLAAQLQADPDILRVETYYDALEAGDPIADQAVSADRSTLLIRVTLGFDGDYLEQFAELQQQFAAAGFEIYTVGDVSVNHTVDTYLEEDLIRSEVYGLPVAMVVLVIILGALVAAGIPIVVAAFSIFTAVGLSSLLARVTDVSEYALNIIVMIGLAVGIDYGLFIISRYREERRRGFEKEDAIAIAAATTGKAVFFSGITVMLALSGLLILPLTLFRGMGIGAISVVVMAVLASFTLIPALLGLLGDRINWPRRSAHASLERADNASGIWNRIPRLVMRRPVASVVIVSAILVGLTLPVLDMERGTADAASLPPGNIRSALTILEDDFSAGMIDPLMIVVDAPRSAEIDAAIDDMLAQINADPGFGQLLAIEWNPDETMARLDVPLTVLANDPAASASIEQLRNEIIPSAFGHTDARVLVGGDPAVDHDFTLLVDRWTPRVFAMVLGLSFLLLLLAFRSIVIPIKAIIMNLLSVGATYGLMVLVFQKGYGVDLLGFQQTASIETWVPVFLFCILFGLSMDYHVFLLSRIKEQYDQTHDNTESVVHGIRSTARLITGAAIIMVAVFAAFAAASLSIFQQLGFGLAVAVLLDATIIRIILVPASMKLLGDWNWYLPRWLSWLPEVHVDGGAQRQETDRGVLVPVAGEPQTEVWG